ncbi:type II toxin-antitoxin system Phd/YefM family antitoxin [Citricoccus sp. NPDC055426]|uniref:type II toxin-antitoxin system Phd/YefM family antitoxin n=1 Tax=Citricoccus sp. NPDC055426 TaxID=3155536 RepID=UPI0034186AAB
MIILSVSEARKSFADVVEQAKSEAVFIEKRGVTEAVVISRARYESLMEASEEAEDLAAFDEVMAEEGENIPWDQVKADLGWT